MTGAELIPATAWEQAVFVSMFFILIVFIFTWIQKFRKEDQHYRKEDQQFQAQQQKEWQSFIAQIDESWRAFNKEQRECNNIAMKEVDGSLRDLTTVTQALVSEVKEMRSDTSLLFAEITDSDERISLLIERLKKIETDN